MSENRQYRRASMALTVSTAAYIAASIRMVPATRKLDLAAIGHALDHLARATSTSIPSKLTGAPHLRGSSLLSTAYTTTRYMRAK
jgi:hypothetical protein